MAVNIAIPVNKKWWKDPVTSITSTIAVIGVLTHAPKNADIAITIPDETMEYVERLLNE